MAALPTAPPECSSDFAMPRRRSRSRRTRLRPSNVSAAKSHSVASVSNPAKKIAPTFITMHSVDVSATVYQVSLKGRLRGGLDTHDWPLQWTATATDGRPVGPGHDQTPVSASPGGTRGALLPLQTLAKPRGLRHARKTH